MNKLPWMLSAATAIWFGAMAYRDKQNWLPWALSGVLFSLVATTIVVGLNRATFLNVSHEAYVALRARTVLISVGFILFCGLILTSGLHRHGVGVQNWIKRLFKRAP